MSVQRCLAVIVAADVAGYRRSLVQLGYPE